MEDHEKKMCLQGLSKDTSYKAKSQMNFEKIKKFHAERVNYQQFLEAYGRSINYALKNELEQKIEVTEKCASFERTLQKFTAAYASEYSEDKRTVTGTFSIAFDDGGECAIYQKENEIFDALKESSGFECIKSEVISRNKQLWTFEFQCKLDDKTLSPKKDEQKVIPIPQNRIIEEIYTLKSGKTYTAKRILPMESVC
jgi:hypothetical protein